MVSMVDAGLLLRMATETLAERLKRLRVAKGLSQNALGTQARLLSGGQAIYKVEAGQRRFQPDTAARVAAVLDTTPEYLLYGFRPTYTGDMPPLDVYLRETHALRDDDISAITHLVRRLADAPDRVAEAEEAMFGESGQMPKGTPPPDDLELIVPHPWEPRAADTGDNPIPGRPRDPDAQ
jgi:transcriptional regulator with XRE-family HTH domain